MQVTDLRAIFELFVLSICVSFLIALPIIRLLYKFRIFRNRDVASETVAGREGKVGTPIMGGLIIIIAVLLLVPIFDRSEITLATLLGFFGIALMGGIDDLLNLFGKERSINHLKSEVEFTSKSFILWPYLYARKALYQFGSLPGKGMYTHERTFIEFFVAGFFSIWLWNFSEVYRNLNIPFWEQDLNIGILLPLIWTGLIFLFLNGVNLSDGMDALAAGMLVPSFLSALLISFSLGAEEVWIISSIFLGAFFTYLYFNIPPARVQMGDVGALAIGFALAVLFILMRLEFILVIIGLPYIIEFFSSYLQVFWVKKFKRRLFQIAPIHYHFQKSRSWSEEKVVMRFVLISVVCACFGFWIFLIS